jgi:hypothetical protein
MSGRNINGEGSVYQRKDGRWVAAAYVPVIGGGIRRQAVYAKTRAEASKKLRELLDRAEKHMPVAPASLSVASYLDEWLIHVKQHVRATTWVAYEGNVRLHLKPRIGKKKLVRLGVRDVRLMVDAMRTDGIGSRTIQYVHATLRAALEARRLRRPDASDHSDRAAGGREVARAADEDPALEPDSASATTGALRPGRAPWPAPGAVRHPRTALAT